MNSREKMMQHLTQQKARAVNSGGYCQYREGSLMCAVGCLIADEDYDEKMEGNDVSELIDANLSSVLPRDISLNEMRGWQAYHDRYYMLDGKDWNYQEWLLGVDEHSPALFAKAMEERYGKVGE